MISLISSWQLKSGCPPALSATLAVLAQRVLEGEPGTLSYEVSLQAPNPLDANNLPQHPPPTSIVSAEQTKVVFMEKYADATAFSAHVNGPLFTEFREHNIQYFETRKDAPGWPVTINTFLSPQGAPASNGSFPVEDI